MIFEYNGEKYCFVHIPKCGGTYIEVYILKHIYYADFYAFLWGTTIVGLLNLLLFLLTILAL